MNNLVYIVMDSCRFDTYEAARTPNMDRLGRAGKRYSYASWTSPSHYVLLMGLTPHTSPPGVFASEVYKEDFLLWRERLGIGDMDFKAFIPELSLPCQLKKYGYRTVGRVSLPVLNQFTTFSTHFDDYRLMDSHNDFAGMIEDIGFDPKTPSFHFFNLGETHYPYMLTKEEAPILHGVHGVFKHMNAAQAEKAAQAEDGERDPAEVFFNQEELERLRKQQIKACEYVDSLLPRLYSKLPKNTHLIITADHGELFGEEGYFGHGPVFHEKVFEVPFLEGRLD